MEGSRGVPRGDLFRPDHTGVRRWRSVLVGEMSDGTDGVARRSGNLGEEGNRAGRSFVFW